MADADENGLHVHPRSERRADELAPMGECGGRTTIAGEALEIADQLFFGDTDRRNIERNTEMTGQTEPTRMCQTLSIGHEHIRQDREAIERFHHSGNFAKTKKTRHVWKGDVAYPARPIDDGQIRQ